MTPGILGDFGTHLGELGPLAVQLCNSYECCENIRTKILVFRDHSLDAGSE